MTEPTIPPRPAVLTEASGRVLLITLNRPLVRNAVNGEMARGLEAAIDVLESDRDLWVAVLTGVGSVFCAGADLNVVAAGALDELFTARGGFAGFVSRERTKPVLAALGGDAVAGGMEIAVAADLIVADRAVRLGIPEAARSLLAVGGGLAELPRLIGERAALELALTADLWSAPRLYERGLIARIVDDADAVLPEAMALATKICANAPLAVRASRRAIIHARDLGSSARWALVKKEFDRLADTHDYHEGLRSFIEGRPPRWEDR